MIALSDSISVTGCPRAGLGANWNMGNENSQEIDTQGQLDTTVSSSNRRRSASSALEFRSRITPESYLDSCSQDVIQPHPPPPTQNSDIDPQQPSSSISSRVQGTSSQGDTATFRGMNYHASREATDGKVCLHTHHHHYWIISDSAQLQQAIPKLRSSRERVPFRAANEKIRLDGHMDSWPSEGDVEVLAESRRPSSCDTSHRYFIEG